MSPEVRRPTLPGTFRAERHVSGLGPQARMSLSACSEPRGAAPLSTGTFHIMLAIADGDRHGYGIGKEIEAQTGGTVRLGPATLYRTIKQLVIDGFIAEISRELEFDDDERRRYYRLTPHGRAMAEAEARRLADLVVVARARHLLPAASLVSSVPERSLRTAAFVFNALLLAAPRDFRAEYGRSMWRDLTDELAEERLLHGRFASFFLFAGACGDVIVAGSRERFSMIARDVVFALRSLRKRRSSPAS